MREKRPKSEKQEERLAERIKGFEEARANVQRNTPRFAGGYRKPGSMRKKKGKG